MVITDNNECCKASSCLFNVESIAHKLRWVWPIVF